MRNQMNELSIDELDEVSGGVLMGPSLTPSIPIPPPLAALLGKLFGPSPQTPGGHGSFDPALLQ
jgi:bacteriocin-like protein